MRFALVVLWLWLVAPVAAQQRAQFPLAENMTPAQVQRLFEAYELVQAEEMLGLTDEQYPQFVARLKALQDARRQSTQDRQRMLRQLQRLASQPGTDDARLEERLDVLRQHDRDAANALEQAYAGIDEVLNVRQRVRFRMFEQQMQRRRVEMLQRARRPNQNRRDQAR